MKRILGIVLAAVLIGGVITAVVLGRDDGSGGTSTTKVRGVIGSEKAEFFQDERVREALADQGFEVETESSGSWDMKGLDLGGEDFAFPGSFAPAESLRSGHKTAGPTTRPFYSPRGVRARRPAAETLARNRYVKLSGQPGREGSGTLRMSVFLDAVKKDTAWQDLSGAGEFAELKGALSISSTDPLASNSGALYLATAAYVGNGNRPVTDRQGVEAVTPLTRKLVAVQGYQKVNSDDLFRDFTTGVGTPLVLAYESQIAAPLLRGESADDIVVLYPDTTVFSDHSLVPFTDNGRKLGELLRSDPTLRKLAVQHGFRPTDGTSEFDSATAKYSAHLRQKLTGTVQQAQPPRADVMRDIAQRSRAQK
ncbi:hypothetical protein AAHZ94_11605 [Streptomyces sp. HSW2009]|uniref:hypothetical protein n=1 Tax=Streptomyces sp. HSW2009 TaxID=3142890 RepID=UPI0032EE1EC9